MQIERISVDVVEHLADGILLEDGDGRILYANPALLTMLGYEGDEMEGKHWCEIVPDDLVQAVEEANLRRVRGETDRYSLELLHKNGGRVPVLVSGTPYPLENNELGRLTVFSDVSAQRKAESEVARLKDLNEQIVQKMSDGIVIEDADGYFTFVNPAMARMLGYTVEELTGMHWTETVNPEFRSRVEEIVKNRHRERADSYEMILKKKDGSDLIGLVTSQPYGTSEEGDGVMAVFTDITLLREEQEEKKRLGDQIQAMQKLETVGRLAGGIAHDFNNLLAIIKGQTDVARMSIEEESPIFDQLGLVLKSVSRASDLVRHLLMFSRKQYIDPRPIVLNEMFPDIERLLHPLLSDGITLRLETTDELWPILADPGQIEQVIVNLAVNSRDAMPRGGTLTVRTENVELGREFVKEHMMVLPGEYVLLEVQDTGVGMDADTLGKVFEPFFTTKEEGRGTGLGLSSVYGIIKQNNGYVFASSEPGEGSSFSMYFPKTDLKPE